MEERQQVTSKTLARSGTVRFVATYGRQLPGLVVGLQDPETTMVAQSYFQCRILGAPAALSNYVVQAWLINLQRTDIAMAQNVLLNLCNAVLCVVLGDLAVFLPLSSLQEISLVPHLVSCVFAYPEQIAHKPYENNVQP